ncbi:MULTISPECIES: hypothetical protein [unclassified Chryseobacterium]|uniref:hypothetical protein n=1 Tax=unclassified Chryseobacterium TaxID=2593645 RepID=UPI00100A49E5|nr:MULTISPECIES: hypothetical protein [unclassified Chryseobacterium]
MTKQLKLPIILLITVVSMNVNAQKKTTAKPAKQATENKTSKPSKQETMDWIAGKMKEGLGKEREFVSYSNGEFVYKVKIGAYDCISTVYLNKITGMSPEYSNDFYVKGSVIKYTDFGKEFSFRNISDNEMSIAGPNYNEYTQPFSFKNDDALVARLKKAFTTLIDYNSTKRAAGEAF